MEFIGIFYASHCRRYIERFIAVHSNKTTQWWANNKPEESDTVSEVEHRQAIQPQVLSVHALSIKSITYVIMLKENAPIYKSSRSEAPKTQQFCD